jgi:hypothetical protein
MLTRSEIRSHISREKKRLATRLTSRHPLYCYFWRDIPFYVGRATGDRRPFSHLLEKADGSRKTTFIRTMLLGNKLPDVVLMYQTDSFEKICEMESFLIRFFGRVDYNDNGLYNTLLNHSKGGKAGGRTGPKHTAESREKIAAAKRGVKRGPLTAEWSRNMGHSRRGERNGMYGKVHPEKGRRNPNHPNLKTWTLVDPAGQLHTTTSLKAFCRDTFGSYGQATGLRKSLTTGEPIKRGVCQGWRVVGRQMCEKLPLHGLPDKRN